MKKTGKIKILYLITKSNFGGAQRYVFDLATHLDPHIFEVVVALGGEGRLAQELARRNVRVIHLANLERDVSLRKEWYAFRELRNILRSEKPDILHINSSKAGGIGAFLGRILKVPRIIFTAHGWAFNEERPLWQKILIHTLHGVTVLLSHVTITVSNTTRAQLRIPGTRKKMVTIYNGRTTPTLHTRDAARTFFTTHIPALLPFQDDFWSVTIGELHPIKQHHVVIAALQTVVKTHPQTRHIIIGDGEKEAELRKHVEALGLTEHVFFAGHVPEAAEYLKAFDVFVLASKSEALAYVIIEACFAGLPIIASNVGGIPEIVTHEHEGLLIPQGNVQALSTAYTRIASDSALRTTLGARAGRRAKDFSFENMHTETERLYRTLLL